MLVTAVAPARFLDPLAALGREMRYLGDSRRPPNSPAVFQGTGGSAVKDLEVKLGRTRARSWLRVLQQASDRAEYRESSSLELQFQRKLSGTVATEVGTT